MGFFEDIGNVDAGVAGGNRLTPGVYPRLKIISCGLNTEGFHGTRFVAEFEVLESRGPDSKPEGTTGSWTCRIDGQNGKYGLADVKGFVGAVKGFDSRSDKAQIDALVTSTYMDKVTEHRELEGLIVATEAYEITTKSGHAFTKHAWHPAAVSESGTVQPPAPPVPAPAPFPPAGWAPHPQAPGYFFKGQQVLNEEQLRNL